MMKELHVDPAPRPRPKLDPRLATLLGLGAAVVGPGELEADEDDGLRGEGLRRKGSLAFLRGGRGGQEVATVGVGFPADSVRRTEMPPSVPVFVRVTSNDVLDRLASKGISLVSRARTIATADVPVSRIEEIEEDEGVLAVEWTGAFRPLGGAVRGGEKRAACASIGLDPAQFGDLDGRGCILGVVDVEGLDLYHPCFVTNRGRTKVVSLWDQRAERPKDGIASVGEPGPGGLGVVYREKAIGLEIASHQLVPGSVVPHRAMKGSHGTLVSALAMGNGDDHADARGVAPGAELVFVSTFGSGPGALGAMTELADAIAFVMNEAKGRGKPCVVNISLGDTLGPHDGTSPIEQFIDEMVEEGGRAVVIAAGNAHGEKKHAVATLEPDGSASFSLHVAPHNTERVAVEIWYHEGPDAAATGLQVEIEAPGDGGRSPVIEADGIPRAFDAGNTRVLAISMAHYPGPAARGPGNAVIRIEISAGVPRAELLAGSWKLHLRSPRRGCTAHAWVDHRYARWQNASDSLTLTTPATARKAIVVGAYDAGADGAAWFSGRGEDRGGLRRPDVLAPGVSIVGACAESPVRYVSTASGTSVAAPIVAGVAALVFQQAGAEISGLVAREKILAHARAAEGEPGRLWIADLPSEQAARERSAAAAVTPPAQAEKARDREWVPVVRPRDSAQIVEGKYQIWLGPELAGEILVLPGEAPGITVEHWALGAGYSAPSGENPMATLELRFTGKAIPLKCFLAGLEPGSRHVRAVCQVARIQPSRSNETMTKKNYMQPQDRTQIVEGCYKLFQGERYVGELMVTDDDPGKSTEHWLLYSEYSWPSGSNTVQELRFEYQGTPVGLTSFLSDPPTGATYIIASCEQQTLP